MKFRASEVARITGHNPYQNANQVFVRQWKKLDPSLPVGNALLDDIGHLRAAVSREVDRLKGDDRADREQVARAHRTLQRVEKLNSRSPSWSPTDADADAELRELVREAPDAMATAVRRHASGAVNCAFGVATEDLATQRMVDLCGRPIGRRNDQLYTKLCDSGVTFVGMVDGYDEANECVVEIKNRRSPRIFYQPELPEYDVVQTHVYMYLLGCRKARLFQTYLTKSREDLVTFDDALWCEVVEKCLHFQRRVEAAHQSSAESQRHILTGLLQTL